MKYAFLHISSIEFDGDSLAQKPMGGTETALIGISSALAKNPENEVHVFTQTDTYKTCSGVHYHPLRSFLSWADSAEIDVLLSLRQWIPLVLPVRARWRVYFSPDAHDQPFLHSAFSVNLPVEGIQMTLPLFKPADFMAHIDEIFCVGRWQATGFVEHLGFPSDKIHVTRNGIFPEFFAPKPLARRHPRLVYSSTPFRGLEHLLEIFPKVHSVHPDVGLDIFSGMKVYGVSDQEDSQQFGGLYEKLRQSGALVHGSVSQAILSRALSESLVFAYPNTFDETFCISVLEAEAAGLPVVTSARAALSERVNHGVDGFLVEGDPSTPVYRERFTRHVLDLIENPVLWQKMSDAAVCQAKNFSYDALAREWESHFESKRISSRDLCGGVWKDFYDLPHYELPHPAEKKRRVRVDQISLRHLLRQYAEHFSGWKAQDSKGES